MLTYHLTNSELSVSNWNALIRFIDNHKIEVLDLSQTYKTRIIEKLDVYRNYYSTEDKPIRRENISPNVYILLGPVK